MTSPLLSEPANGSIPKVLLRYQAEAVEISHGIGLFVWEKSRRIGASYGFAADAPLVAAPAIRAMDVMYIGTSLDMAREFLAYVGDFTKSFDLAAGANEFRYDDGSEKGVTALRVTLPSGYSVVALSSRPRSIRGRQGLIIIDEAAFQDSLEELLKAAIAMLMWGGRVVVISTHNGEDGEFNDLIKEIRSGKRMGVVYRTTLADALADGLFRRICLRNGKPWSAEAERQWEADLRKTYGSAADEELDVIPAKGGGIYLPRAMIEACQSPAFADVPLVPPSHFDTQDRGWQERWLDEWLAEHVAPAIAAGFDPRRRSFFGQDFARSSDLSVVACGQIDERSRLVVPLVIEMRNVPFRAQKRLLDFLVRTMPQWSTGKMDARGNGQQLAEDMRQDWGMERIEAVMATQNTYLERMPRMKSRFEDRTILIPQVEELVEDLRQVKQVRGIPQVVERVADGAGTRHGDFAIALMNLVCAADEDVQPIDHHAAERPRGLAGDFAFTGTGFGTVARQPDFAAARGGW